jgi:hypothetical protein
VIRKGQCDGHAGNVKPLIPVGITDAQSQLFKRLTDTECLPDCRIEQHDVGSILNTGRAECCDVPFMSGVSSIEYSKYDEDMLPLGLLV